MKRNRARAIRLPGTIWALGLTSLFMDSSSEIVHAILPLFLAHSLMASNAAIGLIDGLAESMALVTKIFSGAISDYWRRRKPISTLGYAISAISKLVFPLAATSGLVLFGRLLDRFGKGVRGAPRDALIADWVAPEHRGYAYGVRQALDNIGAVVGPLVAVLLLQFYAGEFRPVLWWAILPAVISVVVMAIGVKEPEMAERAEKRPFPLRPDELRALPPAFWLAMGLIALMLLPRVTEAFMILRADDAGIAPAWAPLTLVIMSAVSVPFTPIAGLWSDRYGRGGLIAIGFLFLILAHLAFAYAEAPIWIWLGSALWGLHVAFTQGIFSALVADYAPAHLRGTAFGVFNLLAGIAILLGSWGLGAIWDGFDGTTAFLIAAGVTLLALLLFLLWRPAEK